eukprot:6212189-Pleurochrysis_carterae.AAC.4
MDDRLSILYQIGQPFCRMVEYSTLGLLPCTLKDNALPIRRTTNTSVEPSLRDRSQSQVVPSISAHVKAAETDEKAAETNQDFNHQQARGTLASLEIEVVMKTLSINLLTRNGARGESEPSSRLKPCLTPSSAMGTRCERKGKLGRAVICVAIARDIQTAAHAVARDTRTLGRSSGPRRSAHRQT